MNKIEQRLKDISERLGGTSSYFKQMLREHLGEIAKEAYTAGKERGMYEQECLEIGQLTGYDPSIPTFEEWLNE